MKKEEADRLRDIANELDDHCYDIYHKDHTQANWFHWASNEIRKVIINAGFNGIINEKYSKTTTKWEEN